MDKCNYPDCTCPFDMGPDGRCAKGLPRSKYREYRTSAALAAMRYRRYKREGSEAASLAYQNYMMCKIVANSIRPCGVIG
jgi:hypothetical protein